MDDGAGWGFLIAIICGLILGGAIGISIGNQRMQTAAIEHGCAAYDTVTGDWSWIGTEEEK